MTFIPQHTRAFAAAYLTLYVPALALLLLPPNTLAVCVPLFVVVAPAAAIAWGLWKVKLSAWYALMGHAAVVCATGFITALYSGKAAPFAVFASAFALVFAAAYLRPDARSPYFSSAKRGFRKHVRYETSLRAKIISEGERWDCQTFDISEGGAYVHLTGDTFPSRKRVSMELSGRDGSAVWLSARVVGVHPQGIGHKPPGIAFEFLRPSKRTIEGIRALLATARRYRRWVLELPVEVTFKGQSIRVQTYELAEGGCYLKGQTLVPGLGEQLHVSIDLHDHDPIELVAEVVWRRDVESNGKPPGVACKFIGVTVEDARRLRARLVETDVVVDVVQAA